MITKSYVALQIVLNINRMFVSSLPKDIRDNAARVNKERTLIIGEDFNTYYRLYRKLKAKKQRTFNHYIAFLFNCIINIWYSCCQNL